MKNITEYLNEGLFGSKKLKADEFAKLVNGTWYKKVINLVPENVNDEGRKVYSLQIRKWKGNEYAFDNNGDPLFEEEGLYYANPDEKKRYYYFNEATMANIYKKVCEELKNYNRLQGTRFTPPKLKFKI